MAINKNLFTERENVELIVGVKIKVNWKNQTFEPDEITRRELLQSAFDDEAVAIAKYIREEIMKPPKGTIDGINQN